MKNFLPLLARRRATSVAIAALLLGSIGNPPAFACMGTPPPPVCGKTLALAKAAPPVFVVPPAGGTVTVPTTVFFGLTSFPPGAGACPTGPYSATVALTVTCAPPPGGGGTAAAGIGLGFNPIGVPVTVPAGPVRLCTIAGTATVGLSDGMTLTAAGDTVVCLVDPAPQDPTIPRLDMQLVAGSDITSVHPGDQGRNVYQITNNDPVESFTGTLTVEMNNVSRLPSVSGPMPPGTGPFSVSDPAEGDNFPIGFLEDLDPAGCLPLPPDPQNPAVPTLSRAVSLGPGEVLDVEVFARTWPGCADGSCGEATLILEGSYSDDSEGLACHGFVLAADKTVPPSYAWPDAGRISEMFPLDPAAGVLEHVLQPRPDQQWQLQSQVEGVQLFADGQPVPADVIPFAGNFGLENQADPNLARTELTVLPQVPISFDSQIELSFQVLFGGSPAGPPVDTRMTQMEVVPGAPSGFEATAPVGLGRIELFQPGVSDVDSLFDLFYQLSVVVTDELDQRIPLEIQALDLAPLADGSGLFGNVVGRPGPGAGGQVRSLELRHDFRGFGSSPPPPVGPALTVAGVCPGDVTITMSGVAPGASVALAWSSASGPSQVPGGVCAGTPLELATPNLLTLGTADGAGEFTLDANAPAVACGAFLQGIDLDACATTNLANVP